VRTSFHLILLFSLAVVFTSCINRLADDDVPEVAEEKSIANYQGGFEVDKNTGLAKSSERSEYDSQSFSGGSEYSTNKRSSLGGQGYDKKRFSGAQSRFGSKTFSGAKDQYASSPYYVQQTANSLQQQSNYQGGTYTSSSYSDTGTYSQTGQYSGRGSTYQTTSKNYSDEFAIFSKKEAAKISQREANALLGR